MNYQRIGIVFIVSFCILYAIYYFFIIKKCKKDHKYVSQEVNLILIRHKINIKKIDVYQMVKVVSLVTVFILSIVIALVLEFSQNTVLSIFVATIISIMIAIICYELIGRYYKNKSIGK